MVKIKSGILFFEIQMLSLYIGFILCRVYTCHCYQRHFETVF